MSRKTSTRYITEQSQVPEGFVPMANYRKRHDLATYRSLCDAHAVGEVRAVKLVRCKSEERIGPVWVHPGDADRFIASYTARCRQQDDSTVDAPPAVAPQPEAAPSAAVIEAICKSLAEVSASLSRATEVIVRLADAAEAIATQPARHDG